MRLEYYVINPTGNMTILVTTPVPVGEQPRLAEELLWKEKSAEQVGFVREATAADRADIVLRMAGGEFCGNATMSTAVLYADRTGMETGSERDIYVRTSGTSKPLCVKVSKPADGEYKGTVEMPCPSETRVLRLKYRDETYELPAVSFEGITHLIMEYSSEGCVPEPEQTYDTITERAAMRKRHELRGCSMNRSRAEAVAGKWCADIDCDGLGLMLYDVNTGRLDPLVYIRNPETLYWESSCASGTTALGAYLARRKGGRINCGIDEPGGILEIEACPGECPKLTGTVTIERCVKI